ncbi:MULTISPECIES: glucose-1-phosphate adenylyltransferase [unclassified Candidatus Frackibacter]|uniref:glucose-1-phosphate adenylyltransferase n=1 Tax=unclassified Candidatus Frackibacter TaxID=2648818 RepID=UPI00088A0C0C|nr:MULTISPECIES: glucose-1-phosphate adenylyltransferase [unclassified Candidatus Frackibacter]SDC34122.1 glucose-1-phosphate adenylyltransferase [Candidatus Frackibacter sp. WG11]SEM57104.1 glucose-1-phosphate adenylyltransferase [Candidatus Frackibacter sp. WG12]SFL70173.1 glucose-1-phosphate adenylyltransferase [Candidatus Frackibacter sp. WG13]
MNVLALILAGGRGTRLDILSEDRAKPSVPFGGKYRLIDFTLSNCVNSGINTVGVLTQYLPRSLNKHIGIGKPWDLDRQFGGVTILPPYTGREGGWYKGTAHAVYRNINYIKEVDPEQIIILSGDHIYKMDYAKMVAKHKEKDADLTIAVKRVPMKNASQFGILDVNEEMKITDFVEKPDEPPSDLASMGIYVFSKESLVNKLEEFCNQNNSDFGHHIIPRMIDDADVYAYEHQGYWRDVGTLEAYWQANLDLTVSMPEMNLYDEEWQLHTRSERKPPVKFGLRGEANKSLVSNGAIINGQVINSVISPGVFIEEDAVVKDSVIFNDTKVKKRAFVCKSIIDKEVTIGNDVQIGSCSIQRANFERPEIVHDGLTVVGKGVRIPEGTLVGGNCRIFPSVQEDDFSENELVSGSTIRPRS